MDVLSPTKTGGWPPSEGDCNERKTNTGKPACCPSSYCSAVSLASSPLPPSPSPSPLKTLVSSRLRFSPRLSPDALAGPLPLSGAGLVLPPVAERPSSPRSSCCVTSCLASPHWTPGAGGRVPCVPPGHVALYLNPRLSPRPQHGSPGPPARS